MGLYLQPELNKEIQEFSALGMAHIGDAVYELLVRTWICTAGITTARKLHKATVEHVSATAQATAAERLRPHLSDDELAVYKRGRNAHVKTIPRGASTEDYHNATALETLFGYLYLSGNTARVEELFSLIINE